MNVETGEVKMWDQLTDADKKSGKWIELPNGFTELNLNAFKSKSDVRRDAYMSKVAEKKKQRVNV